MKRLVFSLVLLGLSLGMAAPLAHADGACEPSATYCLATWGFNFNGTVQAGNWPDHPGAPPAGWSANYSGFNFTTGLGKIDFTFSGGPGSYNFLAFFDHDIGPWPLDSNSGRAFGTMKPGQSWQLGDPGYNGGDTYARFVANTLINGNEIEPGEYGDVSAALGWAFLLGQGESADITLMASLVAPSSGFYLQEFDAVTGSTLYIWEDLSIHASEVPEPGSLALLATGLLGLMFVMRRLSSI
jgi:hypothetical protein